MTSVSDDNVPVDEDDPRFCPHFGDGTQRSSCSKCMQASRQEEPETRSGYCGCGCGDLVPEGTRFVPSHDSVLRRKVREGILPRRALFPHPKLLEQHDRDA
jgi:hypothetical protein